MEPERPEPRESVDNRQFSEFKNKTFSKKEEPTNCPECGCGFTAKYEDGKRICLYCPNEWIVE